MIWPPCLFLCWIRTNDQQPTTTSLTFPSIWVYCITSQADPDWFCRLQVVSSCQAGSFCFIQTCDNMWDSIITPRLSFYLSLPLSTNYALLAQKTTRVKKKNDSELVCNYSYKWYIAIVYLTFSFFYNVVKCAKPNNKPSPESPWMSCKSHSQMIGLWHAVNPKLPGLSGLQCLCIVPLIFIGFSRYTYYIYIWLYMYIFHRSLSRNLFHDIHHVG